MNSSFYEAVSIVMKRLSYFGNIVDKLTSSHADQ